MDYCLQNLVSHQWPVIYVNKSAADSSDNLVMIQLLCFWQVKVILPNTTLAEVELDVKDTFFDCRTPK